MTDSTEGKKPIMTFNEVLDHVTFHEKLKTMPYDVALSELQKCARQAGMWNRRVEAIIEHLAAAEAGCEDLLYGEGDE